jgi:hypothetical protein
MSGSPLYGKLLDLPTNIRLVCIALPSINTLAYFAGAVGDEEKSSIRPMSPGANVMKLFTAVIHDFPQ